jgi:2-methylisocitrate lyase-like PEP mutase family enzyme
MYAPPMSSKTDRFRELHRSGCFVIPNPWDLGSARILESLGFKALATTSSGFAWTQARRDTHVALDEVLAHYRAMADAVDVPINADFEGGFAVEPHGVAANVTRACATGIAGLSIEDSVKNGEGLYDFDLAVARIRAARAAIDATRSGVLLVGRSEGFIAGRPDLDETIRRLKAYADAGSECLYAPGLKTISHIKRVVDAVAPKPVNVLVASDFTTLAELERIGVRRVSVGGALARTAWAAVIDAGKEMAEKGTFTALTKAVSGADLQRYF